MSADCALCPLRPEDNSVAAASSGAPRVEEQGAEEQNEDETEEHPAEEARAAKPARDPGAPSKAEQEAHEATHLPFRVWCPECVKGRRDNPPHKRISHSESEVPVVLMDYCFVRREGEDETLTILLMKDQGSRAIRAWVVPHKGADTDGTADRAVQGIRDLGHRGPVVFKTDNEPALLALREALMARLPEGAIPVTSPAGESQSNGAVENAVKLFKGLLRVHLAALERKAGVHIPSAHPVLTWLAEHVADVLTKYLQGSDGRTAFERLFSKPVREEGLEFGEQVFFRKRKTNDMNVVLDARWAPGVWLGRRWGSITHRVHYEGGVVDARAIQRRPLLERWAGEALAAVRATPWCTQPGPIGENEPLQVLPALPGPIVDRPPARPEPEYRPKRVYIQDEDLERYGYTANCRRCMLRREGGKGQGVAHRKECRERIEAAMREAGDVRFGEAEERITEELHRRSAPLVEAADAAAAAAAADDVPYESVVDCNGDAVAAAGAQGGDMDDDDIQVEADEGEMVDFLGKETPRDTEIEATQLYEMMLVLGVSAPLAQAKVVELYSPPRVTSELAAVPNVSLGPGLTFDLKADSTGKSWDFTRAADRREALRQIQVQRPYLVIGSPPCASFCSMNVRLNYPKMDPADVARRVVEGKVLLDFALQVYKVQLENGRHFLHEHPASAASWAAPGVQRLLAQPGIAAVTCDQCRFGLQVKGENGEYGLAKKPTRFMSSSAEVLKELDKKCNHEHEHVPLMGKQRTTAAAIYTPELCRAMLRGIEAQLHREGRVPAGVGRAASRGVGLYALGPDLAEAPEHDETRVTLEPWEGRVEDEREALDKYPHDAPDYWDANTGEELPKDLTAAARREELEFMRGWEVWDVVPVSECLQRTGKKPLGGKWVDVNKGDREKPDVRSRYVAKEIAFYRSDDFFAATPPLEALRMLISHVASSEGEKLLLMDARKAHLHASAIRLVYVDLPPEERQPGCCGRLRRCLYGTRDAPARWEAFMANELEQMGFVRGRSSPCCFTHPARAVKCVVHGDDFTFAGLDPELKWVEEEMNKRFLIKVLGKLGPDEGDVKELRILNRVLRWSPEGIHYEADPRHAEILLAGLAGVGERAVTTAGVRSKHAEGEEGAELSAQDAGLFRSLAARANYLAMDRADIAYAAKELCRRMKAPTATDLSALKRVARYLVSSARVVYLFEWQRAVGLQVYVDTDFAGCTQTRRSTSGGCILRGSHTLKHWSSTQKTVTLSSGEAELAGLVKGAGEALGMQSLAADLGVQVDIRLYADSSAAIGICRRNGIGRVRHLAVNQLWVQGMLQAGALALHKVPGEENPADILTKHVGRDILDRHMVRMSLHRATGRAATAPEVSADIGRL